MRLLSGPVAMVAPLAVVKSPPPEEEGPGTRDTVALVSGRNRALVLWSFFLLQQTLSIKKF